MSNLNYKLDLDYIRTNYSFAIKDKELCGLMISHLEKNKSNLVQLAYLGALQTVMAKHISNPLEKLRTFKKGRLNIEKAIKNDENNVEIRYLRYSVQKNAPSFLNYNSSIEKDKQFLIEHQNDVTSKALKLMIEDILKN